MFELATPIKNWIKFNNQIPSGRTHWRPALYRVQMRRGDLGHPAHTHWRPGDQAAEWPEEQQQPALTPWSPARGPGAWPEPNVFLSSEQRVWKAEEEQDEKTAGRPSTYKQKFQVWAKKEDWGGPIIHILRFNSIVSFLQYCNALIINSYLFAKDRKRNRMIVQINYPLS